MALICTLVLLNGAAFSGWMSSGPPNPYQQGWAFRSQMQLIWAVSVALSGLASFRLVREVPTLTRPTIALIIFAAAVGIFPSVQEFIQIDRCLDSGGRWNNDGLQCDH